MTIYRKLLIWILSLSLVPVFIIGYFAYSSAEKSLEYEIIKKLESITELKVKKIESFFLERSADSYVLSKSVLLKNFFLSSGFAGFKPGRLKNKDFTPLDDLFKLYGESYGYRDIMLINTAGLIFYSSNVNHDILKYGNRIPGNFSDVFESAKKNRAFSDVYQEGKDRQTFLIIVAAPVFGDQGNFLGEIFLEVEMKRVYEFINDKTGLGTTGETLIARKVDQGAMFLNPLIHDPDATLKKVVPYASGLPIVKAVNGNYGSGIARDYNSDKVIAAWRPIPMLQWGLVSKMDLSEAFDSVDRMRNSIFLMVLLAISVCIIIVLRITAKITQPILLLKDTALRVNAGDLSARAIVSSRDEVGDLAKTFNDMLEKLTNANNTLREAQRIARLGNWELILPGGKLTWSNELYRILEMDPQTTIPSEDILIGAIHPHDREFAKIIHSDSMVLQTPYSINYRLLLNGDRVRYVNEQSETIFNEKGKAVRSVGILHDITAQREAEHEIWKLNQELEQRVKQRTLELETANKELEAFSYSVSHDLRAPLRSIVGFAEMLKTRIYETVDEKSRHYLNIISESTIQMGRLIDDILSFSRMGRSELMENTVNFDLLIENAIKTLDSEIKGRTIHWKIQSLPQAKGDLSMLQLVINNLVSNAVKFTRNRPAAEIEIGSSETEKEIIYFVKDNGAGFNMLYANKLFGLFQRLHRVDEFSGTGVGLANSYRIIQRHGGRMWAEGQEDKGAIFYFALPKKVDEPAAKQGPENHAAWV